MKQSKDTSPTTSARQKTLWITETAVLTALLVALQFATKSLGQYVTGSCVNVVLAISALVAGLWSGITVAVLSPFFAFLLGVGPQLLPIVPAIAVGNVVFVLILYWSAGRGKYTALQGVTTWLAAASAKSVTLYLLVVQFLCNVLTLNEVQIATFTSMFSINQQITALLGGGLALLVAPILRKALRR